MRPHSDTEIPTPVTWQQRLDAVVAMMREMSLQTDPEEMVRAYGRSIRQLVPVDRTISLSRRGLEYPYFRITRSSQWTTSINPWKEKEKLPLLRGGLLGELLYGDVPRIINDLHVDPSDPAFPYLDGMRALVALPNYDQGLALNMTIALRHEPHSFDPEALPDRVLMSNLFGRATQNLVLNEELRRAYDVVNRELKIVANLQRSLLPQTLPAIPNLSLAVHYQTSQWAGGDYYDIFPVGDGKWGLWIADVSGHGTPAAVMMAITHAIVHNQAHRHEPPSALLEEVNRRLTERYTTNGEAFVTAFYGVFDPRLRSLTYACAGHNPPRLKRCGAERGALGSLDLVGGLPLGVTEDAAYPQATQRLRPEDQLVFYTDGITEATDGNGSMFGIDRLDDALTKCQRDADGLIHAVLDALAGFTRDQPAEDDRTMIVAKVH